MLLYLFSLNSMLDRSHWTSTGPLATDTNAHTLLEGISESGFKVLTGIGLGWGSDHVHHKEYPTTTQ